MPRITRATLRKNAAVLDVLEDAASVPLPLTPLSGRPPLSDITGSSSLQTDVTGAFQLKAEGSVQRQKTTTTRRINHFEPQKKAIAVDEDDVHSPATSATQSGRDTLLYENSEGF